MNYNEYIYILMLALLMVIGVKDLIKIRKNESRPELYKIAMKYNIMTIVLVLAITISVILGVFD